MEKFIFVTQTDSISSYNGPSGENYNIYKSRPFKVKSDIDIDFFNKSHRFEKVGILAKAGIVNNLSNIFPIILS